MPECVDEWSEERAGTIVRERLGRHADRRYQRVGVGAEDVLAERYARGEIAEEEYRERLNVLKGR